MILEDNLSACECSLEQWFVLLVVRNEFNDESEASDDDKNHQNEAPFHDFVHDSSSSESILFKFFSLNRVKNL